MPREFDFPVASVNVPMSPLLWISYEGFQHATGEDLRTPVEDELWDRLQRGLAALDSDFPTWLVSITGFTNDGLTLRFQDLQALRNVASKLRDRGVLERTDQRQAA